MKKLLIMAAIASAAIAAQAALSCIVYFPDCENLYRPGSESAACGVAYLFARESSSLNDFENVKYNSGNAYVSFQYGTSSQEAWMSTNLDASKTYDFYFVLEGYEIGGFSDYEGWVYTSETVYGVTSVSREFDPDFDVTKGEWTQVVPEPTSGVLMLLGLAGLALKRKRV